MLTRLFSATALASAMLLASTSALDQTLYGINYDLRQGPDWDPSKCKSADTIAADLKILSTITKNVRTYSLSDCDVAPVLTAAKSIGLTVWLGVWVSADTSVYDSEVAALKTLIKANLIDDNVVGFNVGSEAVYRKDITAEKSIEYLKDFKSVLSKNKITIPVSITDIVDILTQYPDMVAASDVVTANQFPFWEKIDASKAVAQFKKRFAPLVTLAGGKEVVISETGWPSAGTNANASVASPEAAGVSSSWISVALSRVVCAYCAVSSFSNHSATSTISTCSPRNKAGSTTTLLASTHHTRLNRLKNQTRLRRTLGSSAPTAR